MKKAARYGRVGLLGAMIGLGLSGCAWGPLKTGAPHLDHALAAIHEAGYPAQMYQGKAKFNPNAETPKGRYRDVSPTPY